MVSPACRAERVDNRGEELPSNNGCASIVNVKQLLKTLEGLAELEPSDTYPQRAGTCVAQIVHAAGYRIEDPRGHVLANGGARPKQGAALRVPLRHADRELGVLYLTLSDSPTLREDELELIEWGARMLARGLDYGARVVAPGSKLIEESIADVLDQTSLTPREREVVALLVAGSSTRDIAEATGLALSTVNTYMRRIFTKIGVHSRVELVARVTGTSRSAARSRKRGSGVFAKSGSKPKRQRKAQNK